VKKEKHGIQLLNGKKVGYIGVKDIRYIFGGIDGKIDHMQRI
jgi:hypothetical protein